MMSDPQQWEYRVEAFGSIWSGLKTDVFNDTLNEWGEQGWEVVGVAFDHSSSHMVAVAKRPLTEAARRQRARTGAFSG